MAGRLRIRPATGADTASVVEITRNIWEGSDYVPYVWHRWLTEPSGLTYVATIDGQVAGFHHIAIHPDNTAWMEGMRTAESWRARGIASALLEHGVEVARDIGLTAARLSTWGTNDASRRVAEKAGMILAGEFTSPGPPTGSGIVLDPRVRLASWSDLRAVRSLLAAHDQRFYTEGWTAYALDDERLELLVAISGVAVCESDHLESVAICTAAPTRPHLRLGLLAGSLEGQRILAGWLPAKAAGLGLNSVRATVLATETSMSALARSGYSMADAHTMLLWEVAL